MNSVPADLPGPDGAGPPRVMYLGRINWEKGLDRLVRAMKWVPGAHLEIIGNDEKGYRPKIEQAAQEAGVSDRVSIEGPVYGPDKYRRMAKAHLFVLPSYSENFGIAALEAMAAGCPVVVTPQAGLADLSALGGIIVAEGEPEPFGRTIQNLLIDSERLTAMRGAARRSANQMDWQNIGEKMERLYSDVLGSQR